MNKLRIVASSIAFPSLSAMKPLFTSNIGVEIFFGWPGWTDTRAIAREIQELKNELGAFPVSIHASMDPSLDLTDPIGSPKHQNALHEFLDTIAIAGTIGAEYVIIHTHDHHKTFSAQERKEAQASINGSLITLRDAAAAHQTLLCVENIGTAATDTILYDEADFIHLFEEVPGIYALVDVGHAHLNKWDTPALLKALGSRLFALHLHDNAGEFDSHLPMSAGTINWPQVHKAITELPIAPFCVLEYENMGTEENAIRLLKEGADKLLHNK